VNYFLKKFSRETGGRPRAIATDAMITLENHRWPGNVRELENVVERALVVSKSEAILVADLPGELASAGSPSVPAAGEAPVAPPPAGTSSVSNDSIPAIARKLFTWARENSSLKVIPAVERELIVQAMQETGGNQVQAAKILGITRATLRKRLEKFKIKQALSIE
jgi:two-component system nitrogen regulation response regulator GlnG